MNSPNHQGLYIAKICLKKLLNLSNLFKAASHYCVKPLASYYLMSSFFSRFLSKFFTLIQGVVKCNYYYYYLTRMASQSCTLMQLLSSPFPQYTPQ